MTTGENSLAWNVGAAPARAVPRVPSGTRIYAVGDVHGRADLLEAVFARIDASLSAHPAAEAVQVFLGDYIDRGPRSRDVIELLIARKRHHAMVCLRGNHEAFAIQFLSDPSILPGWARCGGVDTLLSYGVTPTAIDDPRVQSEVAAAFREGLPPTHHRFLQGLALSFTCGDFFFVHAGVRPGVPLGQQNRQDLLWIREEFLLHEEDFGKVVVHGHSPTINPDVRVNRINIDTGAYATGRLTCLVLEDDKISFL